MIPEGSEIASVTWSCGSPWFLFMRSAAINAPDVSVEIEASVGGNGFLKAEITLDSGERRNQVFRVDVVEDADDFDEPPPAFGPTQLTVTV